MLRLRMTTPSEWLTTVLGDLDTFLMDHAACERKASAMAMSLVAHYPDKDELVREMCDLAIEEMDHFRQVIGLLQKRGVHLGPDEKDPYVGALTKGVRKGTDAYFLDRLLVAGIVEARGCERFGILADGLPEGPLKSFYEEITRAEARHHGLFVRLARSYFSDESVDERLDEWLDREADIIRALPIRVALH